MKNQILKEFWDKDTGVYRLTVKNKWGVFSAESICADEDREFLSRWTGVHLCEYKILIKTFKAKAQAFSQRAIGIRHACKVLVNTQKQLKKTNSTYGDVITFNTPLDLLCCAEAVEKEAKGYRLKAKELIDKYPYYADHLLKSKKKIRDSVK